MGFNMSWLFVDGIDQDALYEALDLAPTGDVPDHLDLGTSSVPLAGATLKTRWCAVFAKYALVMDLTIGAGPQRLVRLPAKSRIVTCVVLEHAMMSFASFWEGGRQTWQIRHDLTQGNDHLEISGDLPPEFTTYREIAMDKQRAQKDRHSLGEWGAVDYVLDVPLDIAATITGYWHDRPVEDDFFGDLQALAPTNGNVLNRLCQPPTWWQTAGSIEYEET